MDKLRSVNTSIWSDTWFEDLPPTSKLLFIYFITNEKTNMLGIYEISVSKISFETGINKETISKALEQFVKDKKIKYLNNHLILVNYLKHQRYNPNMKKSAVNAYNDLPECIKHEAIDFIEIGKEKTSIDKGFETLCKAFGMVRKIEDEYEVEEEEEKEYKIEEEIKEKNWQNDFGLYKDFVWDSFELIKEDTEYITKQERLNPNINILLSIEKGIENFWATEAGWANKKKSKSKKIDWKQTFAKTIDLNKVYKSKSTVINI
jgi:hypothetical protein